MKKFALLVMLMSLLGCSDGKVRAIHIRWATDQCASNDGLKYIAKADTSALSPFCGNNDEKCVQRYVYEAEVHCNNGAVFDMEYKQ